MEDNKETGQIQREAEELHFVLMLREIANRFLAIILVAIIVMSCTYIAVNLLYKPQYQTKTVFLVSARNNGATVYSNLSAAESNASSFSKIVSSDTMRRQIAKDLGLSEINAEIEAKIIESTNILELRVTAPSPRNAYIITESILDNYGTIVKNTMGSVVLDVFQSPTVPCAQINPLDIKKPMMIAGLVSVAAMMALFCVFVYLRDTVKTVDDARNKLDTKLLGVIPHERKYKTLKSQLEHKKTSILISNSTTGFNYVESFGKLRARIDYSIRKNQAKTLMVSSVMEDEGKSTVSANLALAMKKKYDNVLLIDADLKKSALYKIFEYKKSDFTRINEVLEGKSELKDALIKDDNTGIYLLLGRDGVEASTEIVNSENMRKLIELAKNSMDVVIIDTPPMSISPDAECIAEFADAAVIVVRQDLTPVKIINDMVDVLNASNAELLGCVLNNYRSVDINDYFSYGQNKYGYGKYGYGKYNYGPRSMSTAEQKEEGI